MLRSVALLVCLGACGGSEPARPNRRADPAALIATLEALAASDGDRVAERLAAAVLAHCGDPCACLGAAVADAGAPACQAADPTMPAPWPSLETAGRYLADQVARAQEPERARLIAALAALRVPFRRIDTTRWKLTTAAPARPLSGARMVIGIDVDRMVHVAPMPVVRFDARGARVEASAGAEVREPRHSAEVAALVALALGRPPPAREATGSGYGVGGGGGSLLVRAEATGRINATLPADSAIVAVDAQASAASLVQALGGTGAAVAVSSTAGAIGELPIAFAGRDPGAATSACRLTSDGVEITLSVEGFGDQRWAIRGGRFDRDAVVAALSRVTSTPGATVAVEVDSVTAGDLIALIELVLATSSAQLVVTASEVRHSGMRGRMTAVPSLSFHQPDVVGELDPAIIRRTIKRNRPKLQACYEQGLRSSPGLAGVMETRFTIAPTGVVLTAEAVGVDPTVASCVSDALRGIEFPRSPGRGGKVSYRFTFRPTGG